MKRKTICISILSIALLSACKKEFDKMSEAQKQSSASGDMAQSNQQANEILIKFKKGMAVQASNTAMASISGTIKKKVLTHAMQHAGDNEGFLVVRTSLNVLDAVNKLKALPEIQYAEPNYIYKHTAVSNDPYYTSGALWGMYGNATTPANQYGSQAGEAWAKGHTG